MTNMIWLAGLVLLATFGACSNTETNAPTPAVTAVMPQENYTTYTGEYTYTDATGKVQVVDDAKARVVDKANNQVEISFNVAGSPTVRFTVKKNGDGDYANVDLSQQKGISFKASTLDIGVSSTSPIYTLAFSGTR